MIRPLAAFLHVLDAARTAGTLARTVRVLGRQLDNAHLLAASEEARADRAEAERDALQIERDMARDEVDELRRELEDWREASGELAAEQPADDALPDLTDAGEAPVPIPLTNPAREAEIQQDRADALAAALRAAEMDLIKLGQGLYECWKCTAMVLREQIAAAHRAAHARAPTEQIPGVAAVGPCAEWSAEYDAIEAARATAGTDDPPPTRPSERTAPRTT